MEIIRAPVQVQIGDFSQIPGFIRFKKDRESVHFRGFLENTVDAIYCRNFLENTVEDPLKFLQECFRVSRPGGRIDVRVLDTLAVCGQIVKTDSEAERDKLCSRLFNKANLFWEDRLGMLLSKSGFHRVERLPTKDLHMIAFKPELP